MRARPGAKVTPEAGKIEPTPAAPARLRPTRHALLALLHRPADLRGGPRDPHHADRRRRLFHAAGRAVSRDRAADHRGHAPAIPAPRPRSSADTVATPLEQEINGVENMLYMSSQATGDGQLQLTVTFKLGTDLDTAQVLVQNRVAVAEPRLPEEVRRIGVTVRKNSPDLLMVDPPQLARRLARPALHLQLRDAADQDVLARLDGVGDVRVFGARDYAMRIWLDPEQGRGAQPDRRRGGRGAARPERPGRLRRARPAAGARARAPSSSTSRRSAG